MTETTADLKARISAFLRTHGQSVPAKTQTSQKEHLEVWLLGSRRRAIGLEMDHDGLVNLWVTAPNIPPTLAESVSVTRKTPKGRKWTDENGKGANSNLSAYDEFRTKPIARLRVSCFADAQMVLNHLNR